MLYAMDRILPWTELLTPLSALYRGLDSYNFFIFTWIRWFFFRIASSFAPEEMSDLVGFDEQSRFEFFIFVLDIEGKSPIGP